MRTNQLLLLVQRPVFVKSLKEAHAAGGAPAAEEEDVDSLLDSRNLYETERQVFPSLSNFAEGLNDQLWRAFQSIGHTNIDYLQRIGDENKLIFLCDSLLAYFGSLEQHEYQARVAIVKLNYIYYKNDSTYQAIKARLGKVPEGIYFMENSQ